MDECIYYVTGSTASDGTVTHPASTPFSVYRVADGGLAKQVFFWEPSDQTWNRSSLPGKWPLLEDLLSSGGWVRELNVDEFARDVPNYDEAKFASTAVSNPLSI